MLHDGESLLVHTSEYHYRLVPPVEGDQEVLPMVDHVTRHRILNARLKGRFDHLEPGKRLILGLSTIYLMGEVAPNRDEAPGARD